MRTLIAVFFIIFSISSQAAGFLTPDNNATISWVNVEQSRVRFGVKHIERLNPDTCSHNDSVILTLDNEYHKAQYAVLLAAYAAGKKVRLYVSGCLSGWGNTYPKLLAVYTY